MNTTELAHDPSVTAADAKSGNKATFAAADTLQHQHHQSEQSVSKSHKILDTIFWTPSWCRWDPVAPLPFTLGHNFLYAGAAGFSAATLYYSHPILNILANDFHTTQAGVSRIPTLAQAGAATGLVLILPLGDMVPRRRFTLVLTALATVFWIPLCVTSQLNVFLVLTYLSALFTGAPQIMLPLVSELSPPESRAFNISIVASGNTFGILIGRILSGIVTEYTSWRNVYWLALGLQVCVWLALLLYMPDYPAINQVSWRTVVKSYPKTLWYIVTLYPKHAVLVHVCLISVCTFFILTSYWTTLTFLLAEAPYHYNSLDIGLFALVALGSLLLNPLYGKYIIQPLGEPLFSVILGQTVSLIGIVVGTYTGKQSVVGPIIQGFLIDVGLIIVQIANRMSIHGVEPLARNRVNTAFTCILYLGQLAGTSGGNIMYEKHGGWIASGSLSVGVTLFSYLIIAARGPYEEGWIGWSGGWGLKPKQKRSQSEEDGRAGAALEGEQRIGPSSVEMDETRSRQRSARGSTGSRHRESMDVNALRRESSAQGPVP